MGPSAHVEAAWDLGHNRIHHGYTTRQGFDFVWHPPRSTSTGR
jgi:acyl-lipid omega-6 desaturase (Delta-12 desaturase)